MGRLELCKELSGDTWTRSTLFRTHGDANRTSNYVCLAVKNPSNETGCLPLGICVKETIDRRRQVQC